MTTLSELVSTRYFYVVRDAADQHVDIGFVALMNVEKLVASAHGAGCTVTLIEPNNTCH